jgi:hypothetical protein
MGKNDPKCIIQILFDRSDRTYKPGERITGTVEILPGAQCICRKISLVPRWAARGVGPEDIAHDEGVLLPGGILRNNEKVSHTFDFPAPSGPLSYQGESFEVTWLLEARADLSMAVDASAVERFTLIHGQPEISGPSFSIADAYNPFAALAPEAKTGMGSRDKPPAFYAALALVPRFVGLPIVGAVLGYFIAMREEYFDEGYGGAIIWGLIILFGSLVLASRLRLWMLDKRREAQNKQLAHTETTPGSHPSLPGKYWQIKPPDESQRGWPRSVFSLSLGGFGLLLIAVGLVHFIASGWTPEGGGFLAAIVLGLLIAWIEARPCIKSWKFVKTALALGDVEVGFSPERIRPGDEVSVAVDFRSSKPIQISKAVATLVAYEVSDQFHKYSRPKDSGQIMERVRAFQEQDKRHRFARVRMVRIHDVKLAEGRTLLSQESASLSGKITIPADVPDTFLAVEHKVLWFLKVWLKFSDGIQWSREIPVWVRS